MGRKVLIAFVLLSAAISGYFYVRGRNATDAIEDHTIEIMIPAKGNLLKQEERSIRYLVASLPVMPGLPFPSSLCWEPLRDIGQKKGESLEEMLHEYPLDFLESCLKRYNEKVQGYRSILEKQERVGGKLQAAEKIRVSFRDKPFSVNMKWLAGARNGGAARSLYVEGENNGKMLAMPTLLVWIGTIVERDVDCAEAKASGLYTIDQFGIQRGTERTLASMRKAQKAGTLHLKYEGLVTLKQVGDRPCYKLVRTPYDPPEEEGVNDLTLYIDQETLLQVGSVLRDSNNQLIAEYFFRDIELNPKFDAKTFTRKGL